MPICLHGLTCSIPDTVMRLSSFSKIVAVLGVVLLAIQILPYDRMTPVSYIIPIVASLLLLVAYRLTKDLASPPVIICFSWSISLFLASLNITYEPRLSHFNQHLTTDSWLIIFFSILCFYLGSLFAMFPLRTRNRLELGSNLAKIDRNRLRIIALLSFGIAFAVYSLAVVKNGGVPAFSVNVNADRAKFIPGTLGVFLTLFQLVVLITVIKVMIYGIRHSKLEIVLSLTALICSLLTTQRVAAIETVLMSIVAIVVIWPYTSWEIRRIRTKPLIIFGGLLLSLFVWSFVMIGDARGLTQVQLTDLGNQILEQLFIYFGGPAPRNLQMAMEGGIYYGSNETKYGALFFRPLLWFTGFRNEVSVNDTFQGPNNATALFHYYIDFGLLGITLISLFWGVICGAIYGHFRRTLSLQSAVLYAIFAAAIYFIPLSERFSEPSTFIKAVMFLSLISIVLFLQTAS